MSSQQYKRAGSFVQSTQIWGNEDDHELLVRLYQNVNAIALVLNTKTTGAFYEQEFVTGDLFFANPSVVPPKPRPERQVSRVVVNFGVLPAAGTKSVPHNLEVAPQWTFTRIYGCATNPSLFTSTPPQNNYIPLPYVSVLDPTGSLELSADTVNVNITTGGTDYSAWTITYVILEFLTL